MKKAIFLVYFFFVSVSSIVGQIISGKVLNDSSQVVSFANVLIFNREDTTYVTGTATDANGMFSLQVNKGAYLMRVTALGYDTLMTTVPSPISSLSLVLVSKTTALEGVTVKGRKPLSYMDGNSLITNVANTTLSDLGTVEDVLRFIPMVFHSGAGFEVVGKGAPVYYINRRLVKDLSELSMLASQNIQKIEVIHHPSARYGKSVNAVIIIHTKKRTGDGFSLTLDNIMQVTKYVTGQGLAEVYYRKNKFEISSLVRASNYNDKNRQVMDQTVYNDTIWNLFEKKNSHDKGTNITARIRMNYDINSNHSVGAYYAYTTGKMDYHRILDNSVRAGGINYDIIKTTEDQTIRIRPYHTFSSYYNGTFGKLNIDFNMDGLFQSSVSKSDLDERATYTPSRFIQTDNSSQSHFFAEKLVLTYPLLKGRISVGNESSLTSLDNNSFITGVDVDDGKSHVKGEGTAFFAEVNQRWKIFSFNVGLRFEHNSTKYIKESKKTLVFNDLFPSLSFSFTPKNNVYFSLSYRSFRNMPTYRQLNDNTEYVNRFNITRGNPLLSPSSLKNVTFNFWYKFAYLNISYTRHDNLVTRVSQNTADNDAVTFFTYDNSGKKDQIQISAGIQKQISFLTFNYQASFHKQWYKSVFRGELMNFNKPFFSVNCNNAANWKTWTFSLLYKFSSRGHSNNVLGYASSELDVGVNKYFLNKKLQVIIWLIDVFNTKRSHNIIYSHNFMYDSNYKPTSRMATISLRLNLNNTRTKYKGRGAGSAEKNRL